MATAKKSTKNADILEVVNNLVSAEESGNNDFKARYVGQARKIMRETFGFIKVPPEEQIYTPVEVADPDQERAEKIADTGNAETGKSKAERDAEAKAKADADANK